MWIVCRWLVIAAASSTSTAVRRDEVISPSFVQLDTQMTPQFNLKAEYSPHFWRRNAHRTIREKLEVPIKVGKAKNGILFIGDGMSMATVTAGRIYSGQLNHRPGEEAMLAFEKFPVSGLAKTYCVDAQVADSACTATAYLTGVKTRMAVIGLNGNATLGDCPAQLHRPNHVSSILAWAEQYGKDVGFVTTTRVTHASPAGTYAHIAHRDWESDGDLTPAAKTQGCRDIAHQLVNQMPGKRFKVIMGGGRSMLMRNLTSTGTGKRLDGVDLTDAWRQDKEQNNHTNAYVSDRAGLMELYNRNASELPEYLLGLFHDDHLEYHLRSQPTQPTLQEMTEVAIKLLSRNPKGYFLFVEGGRIDHAHHASMAHLALDETVEYSKAVKKALALTNPDETLIVSSSDHAHTMTVAGYPSRGNDILGVVETVRGDDGVPYPTISYANGIGYKLFNGTRLDVSQDRNFTEHDTYYQYPSLVPMESETHGGEDVPVWALGPWQHLFTSTYEQHLIPHLMAYAMCISEDKHDACNTRTVVHVNSSSAVKSGYVLLLLMVIMSFT